MVVDVWFFLKRHQKTNTVERSWCRMAKATLIDFPEPTSQAMPRRIAQELCAPRSEQFALASFGAIRQMPGGGGCHLQPSADQNPWVTHWMLYFGTPTTQWSRLNLLDCLMMYHFVFLMFFNRRRIVVHFLAPPMTFEYLVERSLNVSDSIWFLSRGVWENALPTTRDALDCIRTH